MLLGIYIGMGSATGAGDTGGGAVYAPSLDFSDARNTQYVPLIF
jgi:hypothetical protein